MRKYGRVDANQKATVDALTKIGASVESLASIGNGCPDLLVGYKGATVLMEVKNGERPRSYVPLTPDQVKWHARWKGRRVFIVYGPADAVYMLTNIYGPPDV